jgi:hypothetical protein
MTSLSARAAIGLKFAVLAVAAMVAFGPAGA